MHHFDFNIDHYYSHIVGLTWEEDLIYRRLMDRYYLKEKPLEGTPDELARAIGMPEFGGDVEHVLKSYFEHVFDSVPAKWTHARIELELNRYKRMKKLRSEAGKISGKVRQNNEKEQVLSDSSTDVCNYELGIRKSNKGKREKFAPPTLEEVRAYCEERGNGINAEAFVSFYESKGWMVGKNKMKNWKSAIVTWESNRRTIPKASEEVYYE